MSSLQRANGRVLLALAIFVIGLMSSAVQAQEATVPKVDFFAGYSWYDSGLTINGMKLNSNPKGFGLAATYNFNKFFGLTLDGAGHLGGEGSQAGTVMVGPRLKFRQERFQPFVHALAGLHVLTMDNVGHDVYNHKGTALKVGGGFDIPLTQRFSFRLFEADYLWVHQNLYPVTANHGNNGNGAELRSGILVNFGGAPPLPPMTMSCAAATPAAVLAGEPVSVSANVTNVPPKKTLTYEWSSTGGKVTGKETTANIDTTGLQPGNYTVTAKAIDPKPAKNQGPLNCTANFTVNEPPKHPPTAQCSANPTTVQAGNASTINVTAGNPDNRTLTYNYTTSAGRVSGNGATATLDTAGASAGPITVTATVTDDRGLSASCNASVNVEVPPPPPQASKINECQFPNKMKPSRVDNTCKAVLDEVALRLQREADAKLVIVGHGDPANKKKMEQYAAERALNSKDYLTGGEAKQGIDPTRIEVRTGDNTGSTADYWLVPSGANFTEQGTTPVDESKMKQPVKKGRARR